MINDKKIVAIICECNPFTEGHKKIINEAKNTFGADVVLLIMSGSYVQRGEMACFNIKKRVETALENGANIIIKIPVEYSLSSASYFALSSIQIINKLKFVDNILFGSNINSIEVLTNYAKKYINEFDEYINKNKKTFFLNPSLYENFFEKKLSPNDILAVEYIKQLLITKSKVIPLCIKRDTSLKGASEIRSNLKNKHGYNNLLTHLFQKKFFDAKYSNLDLSTIYDVNNDLKNKILNINIDTIKNSTFDEICDLLHTKDTILSHIKRSLLHIILDIKEKDIKKYNYGKNISYIHILGFDNVGKSLLKFIKIPYITDYTPLSYKSLIKHNPNQKLVDENTFKIKDKSMQINYLSDKLYEFLQND